MLLAMVVLSDNKAAAAEGEMFKLGVLNPGDWLLLEFELDALKS